MKEAYPARGRRPAGAEEIEFYNLSWRMKPDVIDVRPSGRFVHFFAHRVIIWEGDDGTIRSYKVTEGWAREIR